MPEGISVQKQKHLDKIKTQKCKTILKINGQGSVVEEETEVWRESSQIKDISYPIIF